MANPFDAWSEPLDAFKGKSTMEALYDRLDGAYPHKWRSNFPTPESIDNWQTSWAEAFEEERIKPSEIRAGLKACRAKYDWPPSCAEFIKACKPQIDPLVAYYEAIAGLQARARGEVGTWSHPATFWAATGMTFDLLNQTYSQCKARWEGAFAAEMEKGEWREIEPPMLAIAAPAKDWDKKAAAEQLKALGASEVLKPKTDHKLWAKRILKRHAEGDRTLTSLQVNFAREAMGVE